MLRRYLGTVTTLLMAGALAGSLLLAGCGTAHYRVTTYEGQIYTTTGEPKLDEDSKTYHLRQMDGKRVILNQKDVKEIKQED